MEQTKLIAFTLSITGIHFYGAFLPPVSELAREYQSPDEQQVIRESEYIGTAFLVAISIATSVLAKSSMPLVITALVAGAMFATYEYALRRVPHD